MEAAKHPSIQSQNNKEAVKTKTHKFPFLCIIPLYLNLLLDFILQSFAIF